MKPTSPDAPHYGTRQSGFTLIELMIAITISVFLVGGLLMIVQSTKNAFITQNQLAQLQDNERLAMTFMAEVIQSAGYFPRPDQYINLNVFPASAVFAAQNQVVIGTTNATTGDTVTVRYGAGLNDNIFNCRGAMNTLTANYDTFVMKFWVKPVSASNPSPTLTCTFSSTSNAAAIDVPLVSGVSSLAIAYGVARSGVDTGSCADTYLIFSQMTAADWSNVCSVRVQAFFINPLKPTTTVAITRVIAVMNTAGVNS